MVAFNRIRINSNMETIIGEAIDDSQNRRQEIAEFLQDVYETLEEAYKLERKQSGKFIKSENEFLEADCSGSEINFNQINNEFNMRITNDVLSYSIKLKSFQKYKHILKVTAVGQDFCNQLEKKLLHFQNFPEDYMIMAVADMNQIDEEDFSEFLEEFYTMIKI